MSEIIKQLFAVTAAYANARVANEAYIAFEQRYPDDCSSRWEQLFDAKSDAKDAWEQTCLRLGELMSAAGYVTHRKDDSVVYANLGQVIVQTEEPVGDNARLTLYASVDTGMCFSRPDSEFTDGRFNPAEGITNG